MNRLKQIRIESNKIFDLVCKVLNLNFDVINQNPGIRERELARQVKTRTIIESLTKGYFAEMANTAYAAMNVLTDFVSHQSDYKCIPGFSINPNAYYHRIGEWMRSMN
jgi:hypothetical protein